ncbi:dipeptide ABC transporter ATP-binding protein [Kribbella qitaiheensis]|uniref:Dipeptide ABC transporter ATP-binding protein n=1 Tax=Kribbella qitaiheensis TaxID=1544730 RepID=A0A7G6X7I4_9ACTN|nr:dipeptide ABC transporter ATP-binding protein [Kribbella qitaiheensis]QNE22199.1 dipeptide ABC transporter ATP-binding protein [Kribbella qitaiheensis]
MAEELLVATNLVKHYDISPAFSFGQKTLVRAVDDVDLVLRKGESLGIVGESGCGKSTLVRLLAALEKPTSGSLSYGGVDVSKLKAKELRKWRRNVQVVFQDPYSALNPRMRVGEIVAEPLEVHPDVSKGMDIRKRVRELLELVGLRPEDETKFPHQFSGGQRQRIGIARAIALSPDVLLCDEPVSALDLSVQAQVVNLLMRLQRELGLSIIFVAHDLSVVRHVSDRVAVMYLGRVAELGEHHQVYDVPAHPYTQALLSAEPGLARKGRQRIILAGDPPSPVMPPSGCRFHTRCLRAEARCSVDVPELREIPSGQTVSCHFAEDAQSTYTATLPA